MKQEMNDYYLTIKGIIIILEFAAKAYARLVVCVYYNKLVYIDESIIEMSIRKKRGWSKKREILIGKNSGKSIASFIFNGSCNTELFENYVGQFLTKGLTTGQVIVMLNFINLKR